MLDEVDIAILRIIDKESAAVEGLNLPESDVGPVMGNNYSEVLLQLSPPIQNKNLPSVMEENEQAVDEPATSAPCYRSRPTRKRKLERNNTSYQNLKEELLSLEIYHKRLECLKLERELNIAVSDHTLPLFEN